MLSGPSNPPHVSEPRLRPRPETSGPRPTPKRNIEAENLT